jgi:hypothetical protein
MADSRRLKQIPEEEFQELLHYAKRRKKHRQFVWFLLARTSGLREQEIARLRKTDLVTPGGRIRKEFVPKYAKMGNKMAVRLSQENIEELERYCRTKSGSYLFPGRGNRKYVHPKSIYRAWERLQMEVWGEIRYEFHSIRRRAIQAKYESTGSFETAKEFARHKRFLTTMNYLAALDDTKVSEILDKAVKYALGFPDQLSKIVENMEVFIRLEIESAAYPPHSEEKG